MALMILEAECLTCSETFNPESGDDLTHHVDAAGDDCGGRGMLLRGWGA